MIFFSCIVHTLVFWEKCLYFQVIKIFLLYYFKKNFVCLLDLNDGVHVYLGYKYVCIYFFDMEIDTCPSINDCVFKHTLLCRASLSMKGPYIEGVFPGTSVLLAYFPPLNGYLGYHLLLVSFFSCLLFLLNLLTVFSFFPY